MYTVLDYYVQLTRNYSEKKQILKVDICKVLLNKLLCHCQHSFCASVSVPRLPCQGIILMMCGRPDRAPLSPATEIHLVIHPWSSSLSSCHPPWSSSLSSCHPPLVILIVHLCKWQIVGRNLRDWPLVTALSLHIQDSEYEYVIF